MNEKVTVVEIVEITSVLPVNMVSSECINKASSEVDATHTAISCINVDGENISILLPRGANPCKRSYLLADAIRDDDQE